MNGGSPGHILTIRLPGHGHALVFCTVQIQNGLVTNSKLL
jgi:hypothetical protein